jgi:YD repeat-containing protein
MRVNSSDYFLLDATKRVKSFVSLIGTGNQTDTMIVQYSYDGAGYLTRRDLYIGRAPLPQFWYTNTWRNGDLVESEGFYRDITGPVRILYAVMQYDQSVNIKGYLLPIPDGFEVNRFLSAVNLGLTPQHLHTRTSITLFDPANQSQETFVNRLRSHVISSDGYIQAYTSYTEATPIDPADSFRVRVGYFCR